MSLDFVHVFEPGQGDTTLLLLHGTGGNENDLLSLGRSLMPEAALLSPRGKVLESGMPRFFRRLAEGVFDQEDLARRTQELADFVEQAVSHYRLEPDGVVAVGYSNGANIAASLLLRRPELINAAVLLRAMPPFEPESLPKLDGKRIFLSAGEQDPLIAPGLTEVLAKLFKEAGAEVTLHWERGGHGLSQEELEMARSWLVEA
jgi:phospholipase/carboxylesterase